MSTKVQKAAEPILEQMQTIWNQIKDKPCTLNMPALIHISAGLIACMEDPESARNMFVRQLDEVLDEIDHNPRMNPILDVK